MKIADMSKEEFQALIGKVFDEKLRELLDPDYGLELSNDFSDRLKASIASKERVPLSVIKKKLGLC